MILIYLEYLHVHRSVGQCAYWHAQMAQSSTDLVELQVRDSQRSVYIYGSCRRTESKYSGQLSGSIAFPFPFPLVDCLAVRGFFETASLGPASEVSGGNSIFLFLPAVADCLGGMLLKCTAEEQERTRRRPPGRVRDDAV